MLCFVFYMGFIILQERELRRFNEENRASQKEVQMTGVFNSLSDSILVIQESEDNQLATNSLVCLFNNSKSIEFFGTDLRSTKN